LASDGCSQLMAAKSKYCLWVLPLPKGRMKNLNGVSSGNNIVRLPLTLTSGEAEIIVIGPVPQYTF
jgi:hypothetical protein